jgi:hypothetical protein
VLPLLIMPGSGFESRPCYSTWHPTSTSRVPSLHRSSWCAMSCGVSPRGPIRERVEATIRMTRADARVACNHRSATVCDLRHVARMGLASTARAAGIVRKGSHRCFQMEVAMSLGSSSPSPRYLLPRLPSHWTIVIDSAALFPMCWPRSQRLSPTRGSTVSRAPGSADSAPSSALKSRLCARKDCRPSACSSR